VSAKPAGQILDPGDSVLAALGHDIRGAEPAGQLLPRRQARAPRGFSHVLRTLAREGDPGGSAPSAGIGPALHVSSVLSRVGKLARR